MKFFNTILLLLLPLSVFAQQPQNEKEQEKLFYESIDKQVEKYESQLKLEDWQVFYVDSIITHNALAMREEMMSLSAQKVSNSDIYIAVQDKWNEASYRAFEKILDEAQWTKFLKQGGNSEKKARDKREAKRNATNH